MDIVKTMHGLQSLESEYIIIGGAAMAIRGIKETKDIDILISKNLLKNHKKTMSGVIILA